MLLQRRGHGRHLRDTQPSRESCEGAGGRIAEVAERHEQRRQQDMDPLIGFALTHAEQAPLDHLEGVGLQVNQQEEQSILGPPQVWGSGGNRLRMWVCIVGWVEFLPVA